MDPLALISLLERTSADTPTTYRLSANGDTFIENKKDLDPFEMLMFNELNSNMDYAMSRFLRGNSYSRLADGTMQQDDDMDSFTLLTAMRGVSGPMAGAGVAEGKNTLFPLMLAKMHGILNFY